MSESSLGMEKPRRWEGEGRGKSPKVAVVTSSRAKKKPEGRAGIKYRMKKKNPYVRG